MLLARAGCPSAACVNGPSSGSALRPMAPFSRGGDCLRTRHSGEKAVPRQCLSLKNQQNRFCQGRSHQRSDASMPDKVQKPDGAGEAGGCLVRSP